LRSCALENFQRELSRQDAPWYSSSWGEVRARDLLEEHPVKDQEVDCYTLGTDSDERGGQEHGHTYDPY
jgi:hypothetical protein